MRNAGMLVAIVTFGVLSLAAVGVGAQSLRPTSETYTWSGELAGFDAGTRMMTVKVRVVGEQALSEMVRFTPGDRVTLTWSGFDTYADAIARAMRAGGAKKWMEPFTVPAEFVGYDASTRYATVKMPVPADSLEAVGAVKNGEWVTVTARHRASNEHDIVAAVRAYVLSAKDASTSPITFD